MRIIRVRALIEHDGLLLCVQHPHHPVGTWALPGGHVEENEILSEAIERELVEELGIKPVLGEIRYIHQLFLANGDESLEFFFLVTNGADFAHIDISKTSHGALELRDAQFINPAEHTILPEFLANYSTDVAERSWPKYMIRHANSV